MNYHMKNSLENIILSVKRMLLYFRNIDPMANPRGERSGHLGVTLAIRKWRNKLIYF